MLRSKGSCFRNSNHALPEHVDVYYLMQEMAQYVFDNWKAKMPIHLAAGPALHPILTSTAATVGTGAALADADAGVTPGAPSLAVAEPSLLLLVLASGALGRAIGNADTGAHRRR
jgi:hypothetical protein